MTLLLALACAAAALALWSRWLAARIARAHPPRGAFVTVDGLRLHYRRATPQGHPRGHVLALHGASGNCADPFEALAARLTAAGFDIIAFDRPGHGWSDRLKAAPASPAAQAKALAAGLAALEIERVIVVGHSWAGALAAAMALDTPEKAAGLVLLAPVTHPFPGGPRWYYRLAAAPGLGWLFCHLAAPPAGLASMRGAIAGVFAPSPVPSDYARRTGAALVLRPRAFAANAQDVVGLNAFLSRQAPRPTAIVAGDRDSVVSTARHAMASAHAIPGASLTIVENLGHSPHWSAPDEVMAAIERIARRAQGTEIPRGAHVEDIALRAQGAEIALRAQSAAATLPATRSSAPGTSSQ